MYVQVKTNILKTLDGVHKSTEAKEIAKSDVANRYADTKVVYSSIFWQLVNAVDDHRNEIFISCTSLLSHTIPSTLYAFTNRIKCCSIINTTLRLRNSVEKLTDKISEDLEDENEPIYIKEETVGIVVTKSRGEDVSFSVFGEENDYTQTKLQKSKTEPLLFSVNNSSLSLYFFCNLHLFPFSPAMYRVAQK